MHLFIDNLSLCTKLVSAISGILTILLFYLIGKDVYGREAGLFAAMGFAVHPLLIKISILGLPDSLFLFLQFTSIYVFLLLRKNDKLFMYALMGLLTAITYLTKPEGIFLLLLPLLHIAGYFIKRDRALNKKLAGLFMFFTVFALAISPYAYFIKKSTGNYSMTGKLKVNMLIATEGNGKTYHELVGSHNSIYERLAFALNDKKNQVIGFDHDKDFSALSYLMADPMLHIARYIRNVLQEARVLFKLLLPLSLPLFFAMFYRDLFQKRMPLIFILMPLILLFLYPVFYILERHMSSVVAYLILFSAIGPVIATHAFAKMTDFYNIKNNIFMSFIGEKLKYLIVFIMTGASIMYITFSSFGTREVAAEHIQAGRYLKDNVSSGYEELNVMSLKPFVSFYSGAKFTMLPYANADDVVDFGKLYNVDYIAIDGRYLSEWKHYDELVSLDHGRDDIKLIYMDDNDSPIRLFKIIK
ncbi:MAG: glycosyltransferase family 39 protein [Nitrospira sp.]|nr:glycosyltransferase family 39 protein [bacterium]MBL7050052.1 glycosyltransferase family 39 protein [Nitrospira sp.]